MKKRTYKLLLLALAVVLVALLPLQAHAAYAHQWSESGVDYYGSLTAYAVLADKVQPTVTVRALHIKGEDTTLSTSSAFSATCNAYTKIGDNYGGQVRSLLSKNSYADSYTARYPNGGSVTIFSTAASGTYYLAVAFTGSEITVNVRGYRTDSDGQAYLVSTDVYTSAFTPKTMSTSLSYVKW